MQNFIRGNRSPLFIEKELQAQLGDITSYAYAQWYTY